MVTKISDFLNTTFSTLTLNDAVNNSVVYPGTIVHTTTGTPGAGIGAGLQFQVETSANNNEYGMALETLTTDVTAGSEDFDFIVKLMQNGAAAGERLRLNSAGQLTVLSGMVATSFTANGSTVPTNGMYLPTTNAVGFATNTTERVRIDANGSVGIATTSPGSPLDVNGNASFRSAISAAGTATVSSLVSNGAVSGTTGAFSGALTLTSAAPQISLNNGTSNWITWNANGVAAPTFTTRSAGTKLVLYPNIGASNADYAIGIEGSTMWYSVDTTSAQFKWYGGTTQAMLLSGAGALTTTSTTTSTAFVPSGSSVPTNGMYLPTANTVGFSTNSVERMRITSTGNVMIGTTTVTPAGLAVVSNINNGAIALASLDAATVTIRNDSVASLNLMSKLNFNVATIGASVVAGYYAVFNASNDIGTGLLFGTQTNAAGGTVERMRIDQNGRVGIATTSPGSPLDVNGNASFRSAISVASTATVSSLVSNGAISGTTGTFSSALYSASFNTAGTATVNALASNGAVSGTTGTFSSALYGASFNTAGTATVNALVSNGAISGTTINGTAGTFSSIQNSGNERSANIVSNTWIHATQNLTVASSNISTTTGTGALVVTGGAGIGSNIYAGGNVVAASFQPTSASVPGVGIYLPTTNTLAVSTTGAERMRIDSAGNVGIGTSTIQTGYKLQVEGDFAATSKSFVIYHPTKPGKMLRYGSLESPYHGIRLTGEAEVVDGKCTVDLPDYISGLCHQEGSQVQITNIKHGKTLWIDEINVDENSFKVRTRGKGKYRFYWSFTAIRKDIEDMVVEFDKSL